MTPEASPPRPPRIASWLVDLFSPADHADAVLGDLTEEFSDLAATSGIAHTRRWYWRQSAKTIAHFGAAAFRVRPAWLAAVLLLGLLLSWLAADLPEMLVVAFLHTLRPYSNRHVNAYMALLTSGIPIARVLISLLIGCVVAKLAKGREVAATLTLTFARAALVAWSLFLIYKHTAPNDPTFHAVFRFFLFSRALDLIGIVVGGFLVRKLRSPSPRLLTVA